ncbi:MAG: hypothetical protein QM495_01210 [Lutibacter sp.]|uniref:hypothetical protein n=1 Tax=Lutibacter sp. TaxID=1925666 RepID=UPI0038581E50
MKNLVLLIIILFSSCKITKNKTFTVNNNLNFETENCPENGKCTIELIPNKSIIFKKDEVGITYPIISEGEKTIFKYTYKKNPITNTQDSNYIEIVYAEFEPKISEISLSNSELQNVKFYFGRLCYCKGETGYYPIKNGEFKISELTKNSLKIDFKFNIKEVPQIISKINEIVYFKSNASN